MSRTYYAHSARGETSPSTNWQLLREHLAGVATLAKQFAEATGLRELPAAAEAAGWLHDLGKYRHSFQEYICGRSPMESKQHKEAGAAWAMQAGHLPLSFAILGHHHGMPDPKDAKIAVKGDDGIKVAADVKSVATDECPELNSLNIPKRGDTTAQSEIFTRILLSCLVDADWTDTGEHERHVKHWPAYRVAPALDPSIRVKSVLKFIKERSSTTRDKNPALAELRQGILEACLRSADNAKSIFTLTVPTGGGKTLSGLAFALQHAEKKSLRRIIYVAPYISILDQNAKVIRDALGVSQRDLDVFEHQSLSEPQGASFTDRKQASTATRRAENWDSPVVITTNVQFFESLFSNNPGRCRKLHNIANSIIILDECQSLPPDLVMSTCQMLKQLVEHLGCSVVLCTATQPAFDHETLKEHRLTATEIIPPELQLFDRLKRVNITWPKPGEKMPWPDVAKQMTQNTSALCIVNTKRAALDLFTELKKQSQDVFHLSTSMCPAHRVKVLEKVKKRLEAKKQVYVVSTQLIEAGVDIDFPCVLREMAPLESIIQAAGRCNREGLIPDAGGQVIVFRSEEGKIPMGWYQLGRDVLETILNAGRPPSIDRVEDIRAYFNELYWKRSLDPQNIVGLRAGLKFESVAKVYKLIDDDTVPVVVATWAEHKDEIERLLESLKQYKNRENFRALAPYQVNVFRTELQRSSKGLAVPVSEDIDLLVWHGGYDAEFGRTAEMQELIEAI